MENKRARGAVVAGVLGAGGSLGLMLYAGRRQPSRVLMLMFAIWVVSPFLAALWMRGAAARVAVVLMAAACLAIYGWVAFLHPQVKIGFVFLVVPAACWALVAAAIGAGRLARGRG